ncbi:MAG: hypothetical protein JWQ97_1425 [Phenylobacterium sp.]|nr:hypothetical protein [Phenylobacterium sp.]
MSTRTVLNAAAAAALAAALGVPGLACAQAPAAAAKTQSSAAKATGKPTSDAPAASQTQGTAWAVKQSATPAAAAAPAATAAPGASIARVTPHGDLVETLRGSGQFTTFLKATDATNLTGVLKNNQNLTVFAPTDAAFAALPPGQLDRLMADKDGLQKLLTHHVINARVDSTKIKGAKGPVPSVAGNPIVLDGTGEVLKADNATIIQADVITSNGVLQVVDGVLMPGAAGAGDAAAAGSSAQPAAATANAPATTTSGQTTTTKSTTSQTTTERKR